MKSIMATNLPILLADLIEVYQGVHSASNLVPRMSSLLYLYSGIQEAVRQSDWLFTILRCNSVLCGVNDLGISKFDVTTFFTYCDHHLQLISEIRRITSHFILEAAVKVSRICNLGPFLLQTNRAYFHIKHTCRPQIIV